MPIRPPKEAFIASTYRREWEEIAGKDAFHFACDYALLVLEDGFPLRATPNDAADSHQQMIGARKVLDILKTLSEPTSKPKPINPPTLNYEANYASHPSTPGSTKLNIPGV